MDKNIEEKILKKELVDIERWRKDIDIFDYELLDDIWRKYITYQPLVKALWNFIFSENITIVVITTNIRRTEKMANLFYDSLYNIPNILKEGIKRFSKRELRNETNGNYISFHTYDDINRLRGFSINGLIHINDTRNIHRNEHMLMDCVVPQVISNKYMLFNEHIYIARPEYLRPVIVRNNKPKIENRVTFDVNGTYIVLDEDKLVELYRQLHEHVNNVHKMVIEIPHKDIEV